MLGNWFPQEMLSRGWLFAKDGVRIGRLIASASIFALLFALAAQTAGADLMLSPESSAGLQLLAVAFVWLSIQLWTRRAVAPRTQASGRLMLVWQTAAALIRG